MNIEKIRAEFEAAFRSKLAETGQADFADHMLRRTGQHQEYRDRFASSAWWAWQQSRAAIEVELPMKDAYDERGVLLPTNKVIESIESLGLKVKQP